MALYLGIDQGGSSSRAFVCDGSGNIIAKASEQVATSRRGNQVEQDPDELLQSVILCINRCLASLSRAQQLQLKSAALVSQRSSLVAVNRHTRVPLSTVLSWQDTRAESLLHALAIDPGWLKNITGLRPSAHYGASKMRWCLQHLEKVRQAARCQQLIFLPLAAFLAQRLTQNRDFFVDPATAARTLLFDVENACWSAPLLTLFGIDEQWLPTIKPTLNHYGLLTCNLPGCDEKQAQPFTIPLSYVNGDQSAALFAYGRPGNDKIYLNIGTGAFISRLRNDAVNGQCEDKHLLTSTIHQDNQARWQVMEAPVNGAGSALQWLANKLDMTSADIEQLTLPEGNIPLFINTIGGLAAPYWRTDIDSKFIGNGNAQAKMWAVLESIAFLICENVTRLRAYPPAVSSLCVSGGLSKHNALCQLLANVTNIPVQRQSEVEASVLGSIWWLANQPTNWLTPIRDEMFTPATDSLLLARYQNWQNALNELLKR